MRLVNGKWQCAYCHEELDIPNGTKVREMFVGASGQPTMRALLIGNREIHRCRTQPPMRVER
jgi:hypothetical protein